MYPTLVPHSLPLIQCLPSLLPLFIQLNRLDICICFPLLLDCLQWQTSTPSLLWEQDDTRISDHYASAVQWGIRPWECLCVLEGGKVQTATRGGRRVSPPLSPTLSPQDRKHFPSLFIFLEQKEQAALVREKRERDRSEGRGGVW